jgi:hypothetical protein
MQEVRCQRHAPVLVHNTILLPTRLVVPLSLAPRVGSLVTSFLENINFEKLKTKRDASFIKTRDAESGLLRAGKFLARFPFKVVSWVCGKLKSTRRLRLRLPLVPRFTNLKAKNGETQKKIMLRVL